MPVSLLNQLCVFLSAHSHHYKYYSVISSCGSEWVLFSCAQVLPCYVIDVRLIDERGKSAPPPLQPVTDDHDYDESERDRKKRLLSRVSFIDQWFSD